jgi:hypothetical protein
MVLWGNEMRDREAFRKSIEEYLKRGKKSWDLFAHELGYTREHVSKILYGKVKMPEGFERLAILALAQLGCIRGKDQARNLLELMDAPDFSLADWNESPLATLSDAVPSNLTIVAEAEYQTQGTHASGTDNREELMIKYALRKAIRRYATSNLRLEISRPLLEKKGFLTLPPVVAELSQLIRLERPPDAKLIGDYWKKAVARSPTGCDFTLEAQRLLDYVQSELRSTEPASDSKSLDAIEASAATSTEALAEGRNYFICRSPLLVDFTRPRARTLIIK